MEGVTTVVEPALYLYGFVSPSIALPEVEGVEPDTRVFMIEWQALACAASIVSAPAYQRPSDESPEARLEWVTPRALRHHEVIRALHAAGPVLPLRFGAVCLTSEDARLLLHDVEATLTEPIARFRDKDEWTLRIVVDSEAIRARCDAESSDLTAMKEREATLPEGLAYFARKQREKALAQYVADTIAADVQCICDRLERLGADVIQMPGTAPSVITVALLVSRASLDSIETQLADWQASDSANGASCELIGPWPPYSFVPQCNRIG